MSARSQTEQPFQVVTQKRQPGQGRKLSHREKGSCSEEAGSNSSSSSTGSSGRKRHSREGGGGGRHRTGSLVQGRGRDAGEPGDGGGEGGGGGKGGHTNRHSWDPETAQQFQISGVRLSSDKIERSQSARFDRAAQTTDTNNRFERLNPDTEAPGDQPVRSTTGGGGKGRKRNSRSVSGGSTYRSKSPKRRGGKDGGSGKSSGGEGRSGDKDAGKDKETVTVSCELDWDSGSQPEGSDVVFNGEVSQEESRLAGKEKGEFLDQSTSSDVDKTSGASAQGGGGAAGGGGTGGGDAVATESETPSGKEGEQKEEKKPARLTYTRDELLALKSHALSQRKPESLLGKFFRGGKWCADAWLSPQNSEEKEDGEDGELSEATTTGKTLPKLKNPTTLSIIREHDARVHGKVSLSPQRKSFGSGCGWNTAASSSTSSTSSGKDGHPTGSSSTTANNRSTSFDGMDNRRGNRSSTFHHTNHAHNHTPMTINHTPLRDQRGWKEGGGGGGRQGEREKGRNYGSNYKTKEVEEEPEWMSFGPSDRSEVIELVGLEEHERGRSDVKTLKKEEVEKNKESNDVGLGLKEGRGGGEGGVRVSGSEEEEASTTKTSEDSVGVEEAIVGVVRQVSVAKKNVNRGAKEPENEFMLDGFDFSTSVSMCQALESDEEEEERVGRGGRVAPIGGGGGGGKRGGGLLPQSVTNPHELSSALMKALRVGEETEGSRGHPVNALTLEQIHERENILQSSSSPSAHTDHTDQTAFNRLVAVLQSSGAIQDEPPQPPLPAKLPRPPFPLSMPRSRSQDPSLAGRRRGDASGFGFMLEKEMRFGEDFPPSSSSTSSSSTSAQFPPRIPLMTGHPRESHLNNSAMLRENFGKPVYPHQQAPPISSRPSTLHDKWAERSWVHPESASATVLDYGGLQQRPPVDPLSLPLVHPHQSHPGGCGMAGGGGSGGGGSGGGGGGRPLPNSWAIEMEQRRRAELQSMREREARERGGISSRGERMMAGGGGGDVSSMHHHHHHHQGLPMKPSISLLPTAVMKQLHNSNPTHSLSDIASRPSQPLTSDRYEQEMSGRSYHPTVGSGYGYPEGMTGSGGVGRSEYSSSYPGLHSRGVPAVRPQHRGGGGGGGGGGMNLYAPAPQYLPLPHSLSSQYHNPYLH